MSDMCKTCSGTGSRTLPWGSSGFRFAPCPDCEPAPRSEPSVSNEERARAWSNANHDGWYNPDDPADRRAQDAEVVSLATLLADAEQRGRDAALEEAARECETEALDWRASDKVPPDHVTTYCARRIRALRGKR